MRLRAAALGALAAAVLAGPARGCPLPVAYPGDNAPKDAIAQWMARGASDAGLPRELPVMGALVASGLQNLAQGGSDSAGYFQVHRLRDEGAPDASRAGRARSASRRERLGLLGRRRAAPARAIPRRVSVAPGGGARAHRAGLPGRPGPGQSRGAGARRGARYDRARRPPQRQPRPAPAAPRGDSRRRHLPGRGVHGGSDRHAAPAGPRARCACACAVCPSGRVRP
jgi:hypothetical protein